MHVHEDICIAKRKTFTATTHDIKIDEMDMIVVNVCTLFSLEDDKHLVSCIFPPLLFCCPADVTPLINCATVTAVTKNKLDPSCSAYPNPDVKLNPKT